MREKGFSSLEIIVSLSIAAPLFIALLATLHLSLNTLKSVAEIHQNTLDAARISSMLQGILDDYDSHTLPINPRIHHQGNITYTDNSDSPVLHNGTHPVDPHSDAITALRLSPERAYLVRSASLEGSALKVFACPRFQAQKNTDLTCLIGISPGIFSELFVDHVSKPDKNSCRTFFTTFGKSMSVASTDSVTAQAISTIIPVDTHYTLYVDKEHQLRYFSHCAQKILENQPAVTGVSKLTLNLDLLGQAPAAQLSSKLLLAGKTEFQFAGINNLARSPMFTLLLNR